jgi:hypothetical protein
MRVHRIEKSPSMRVQRSATPTAIRSVSAPAIMGWVERTGPTTVGHRGQHAPHLAEAPGVACSSASLFAQTDGDHLGQTAFILATEGGVGLDAGDEHDAISRAGEPIHAHWRAIHSPSDLDV